MNKTLSQVLSGNSDNHILPFFWQHGEDEATLRKMMAAIHGAGCGAVCVESRPHPDFCGEKWWQDMDVILEEARSRNMKVWILDDSHFPTGYANNALEGKPDFLCRQNLFLKEKTFSGKPGRKRINLKRLGFFRQDESSIRDLLKPRKSYPRKFRDESILGITARRGDQVIDLTGQLTGHILSWEKPQGDWTLTAIVRSRNTGERRNYINMTEEESCRLLIDAVYEPHWQHYAQDFGKTIAGFFSDEPELGNGPLYCKTNYLGTNHDLPWGPGLEQEVSRALGEDWKSKLQLLWREGEGAAQVRSRYMEILTKRLRRVFSQQIASWCEARGVEYIGHLIEDDGQHTRTGCSLGHYFRGLQYQHMSGIDDIGGQVFPQGEDVTVNEFGHPRNGEFYHYGLAKLAQSAAAIEPRKRGNSMCEIFGNYGWKEGVFLEKYLADHFLVRGINYFVPHAFTGKDFPDPDCPPHFYAHGHQPQYRHFGELMRYMNRVATLTSSGRHEIPVAILYHGEAEWSEGAGAMPFEKPLRMLYDRHIDCHIIPSDVFCEPEHYPVILGNPLQINGQCYAALVVPGCDCLSEAAARGIAKLMELGLPVFFAERRPHSVAQTGAPVPEILNSAPCVGLEALYSHVREAVPAAPTLEPECSRIRLLHIRGDTELFFVVNEDDRPYRGTLRLPVEGECFLYDPWRNRCLRAKGAGAGIALDLEPLKSVFIVFGDCDCPEGDSVFEGRCVEPEAWQRSCCPAISYPAFGEKKQVTLPDDLALEQPQFSGFIRYETAFSAGVGDTVFLEIEKASEAVEVFLNGKSLGIQIAPPYRYDLTGCLADGENGLAIEVATTLERQAYPLLTGYSREISREPVSPSGLTGKVRLILK